MAPDERRDEEGPESLRVTDRRRFTSTGEAREDLPAEGPSRVASEPPGSAALRGESPGGRPSREVGQQREGVAPSPGELGISSVFLAFWQGAMMNLGAPDASGARLPVSLDAARESIELLRVLQQKTTGNLSEEEEEMLRHLLHEAQVAYVQVAGGTRERGDAS